MSIITGIDELPPNERHIIVSTLLTHREILVQIRNDTNCDLMDRIEKFDSLIEIFHNKDFNIIVERIKR